MIPGPPLGPIVPLSALLGAALAADANAVALVSASARWTYRELDDAAARLATAYLARGLAAGDRVASFLPNSPELLIHYLACLRAGLVATPLNYRYAVPEIDHALDTAGASMLVAAAERRDEVERSAAARLPHGVIWHGDGDGLRALWSAAAPRSLTVPPPQHEAFIFFTSGSTGLPKGVTHSHASFAALVASAAAAAELVAGEVVLPASSASHVAAISFSLAALSVGGRVVVARRCDAAEVLPLLRAERPAVLITLPAALLSLIRDHAATPADFASVRCSICGGDKVSGELAREYAALTGRLIDEGYGMTETGTAMCTPTTGPVREGSVGPLAPGFTAELRDAEGREVPRGADGRLWLRAPSLMVRYWNAPAATAEVLRDGWIDTGDLMRVDTEGYFWFRGRLKQLIIHDGSNIAPQEVEEALLAHPAVAAAGVIGIHNPLHGETVRAYVEARDPAARPTPQALIDFVRARIAAYKAPEELVFLAELPLNATGKVDRARLKRMAETAAGAT